MDNVLVDFQSGINRLSEETQKEYKGRLDEVTGIFSLMDPMPGAVEAVKLLSQYFDVYILSTAPWKNTSAWSDKAAWVQKYFGDDKESSFYKRLIISHHKNLNKGDFLIDDRTKNGAGEFEGELMLFGSEKFPNWETVTDYLRKKITFQEANDRFMERYEKMSPREKCRISGDDPCEFYTPEEEAGNKIAALEILKRLEEEGILK